MIEEGTEQLSKQISGNINNFIAHHETGSNISKKSESLLCTGKQIIKYRFNFCFRIPWATEVKEKEN